MNIRYRVDLNEAERVGSSDRVKIVAQLDRFLGAFQGDGNWTGTRRYYITQDNDLNSINSQVAQDLGEAVKWLRKAAEGNYAAAIGRFEESIKLDPGLVDASYNLAIAYQRLAFHKKAASILRDLVSIAPENVAYRYALGAALLGAGDLEEAEKAFLAVLAVEPLERKSIFSLAVVLEKRGAVEQARERFRQYLSLDPRGEWADSARAHLTALERSGGGKR